jgi:formylglycine-generating enzyme required for sulfatase activity
MGINRPTDVTRFHNGLSPYGCYDMAGNVWEMTTSHWPDAESHAHTMKGGSFLNTHADVRVTVRWAADDELHGASWLGFRCVMDRSALGSAAR